MESRLWLIRKKNNLSQQELAGLAGVSRKTINAIEADKALPTLLVALKIAQALGVSVDDLFSLINPESLIRR